MTENVRTLSPVYADLAGRIRDDAARLDAGLDVGDSGVVAPRTGGSEDRASGTGRALARELFPSTDKDRQRSYVKYSRLISRLRAAFLEQQAVLEQQAKHVNGDADSSLDPYRQARLSGNRNVFEKLLDAPVSVMVSEPTPMPVEIAPASELQPVLAYLRSGAALEGEIRTFDRGAVFHDGRIDMCKQVVGPTHIATLTEAVTTAPGVRHFLLGNNIVGNGGATAIAKMVRNRGGDEPIETLYLAGNELTDLGIRELADALAADSALTSLWLKRNPLGPKGVGYLADMLRSNASIEVLDLVNTAAGDEGVEILFDALRENTSLRALYLDANAITPRGAQAIGDYFDFLKAQGRVGITGLFLGINRLGDDGAAAIARGISGYQPIEQIDVGANRIQTEGLRSILNAVSTIDSLAYLGLGLYKSTSDMGELPNYFDGVGADLLIDYIAMNDNVSVLELKDTNLRPDAWPDLVRALRTNRSIVDLRFTQIGLALPSEIHKGVDKVLRQNVRDRFDMSFEQFRNEKLRYLKQPEHVRSIDSIYRNAM